LKITEASKLPTASIEKPEEEEVYYVRSLPNTDASKLPTTTIEKPKVSQGISRSDFREIFEAHTESINQAFKTITDRLDKLEATVAREEELQDMEEEIMKLLIAKLEKKK